jgi:hypothetical protein
VAGLVGLAGVGTVAGQTSVLTQHNDNARTGLVPNETLLTPTTLTTNYFGKLFSQPVDGPIYAQPLYLPGVIIPGKGTHNVVFVATQHDSVYAFDANHNNTPVNNAPLWHVSFINPAAGITVPSTLDAVDFPYQDCGTFVGEIGIVGTPVIDPAAGTLFIVARTKEPLPPPNNFTYVQVQRLHALDVAAGAERPNSPVVLAASVPGTGDGSSNNIVALNPAREVQRPGLLLAGGVVYVGFASYCDLAPYHGWLLGYDSHTLQQVAVFNTAPNGSHGGIWMGGGGPAADSSNFVYCMTGDGTFDISANPTNYGDSFLKLCQTNTSALVVADYFTPYNQATLNQGDEDLGSGGAVVLPDSVGSASHPHLVVGAGKDGILYLIDRDNMGHFNPVNNNQIVQSVPFSSSLFGLPAFFNQRLYVQGVGLVLKAYALTNGALSASPVSQSVDTVTFRGATPSISANGTNNGIVWLLAPTPTLGVSTLRAYDAANLAHKFYDSYTTMSANSPEQLWFVKFAVPTIANGKVYVGTTNSVTVLGLHLRVLSINLEPGSGAVRLSLICPEGTNDLVQISADLFHWTNVGPGTPNADGTFTFTDVPAQGQGTRFYRLVEPE